MRYPVIFSLIVFWFAISAHTVRAQQANWLWVHGDSAYNQLPVRKTFGTPHPENNPGSRFYATCWTDDEGKFWLYGGHIWYGSGRRFGDLWCYYPDINQWAWIWGDSNTNQIAVYGEKGVEAATNSPGCRLWSAGCCDHKGNLWLYAGWGADSNNTYPQNDLWRYNISSNQWTWEGGSKTHPNNAPAIATQKNFPDTGFRPRPVWHGNIFAFENDDRIFVFGGTSQNDTVNNHLFSFNTATKEWTWLSGELYGNAAGSYGTKKQYSAVNTPGARGYMTTGIYKNQFVLFGGGAISHFNYKLQNDVWVYNKDINQWAWVNGDNFPFSNGVQPPYCVEDTLAQPSCRVMATCANPDNVDSCGNIYMMGGNKDDHSNLLNDVWMYNVNSSNWRLLRAPDATVNKAVFKTKGVVDAASNPGKIQGYCQWLSKKGEMYLFGGICHNPQSIVYNAMWKLVPDPNCVRPCYTDIIIPPPSDTGDEYLFVPDAFSPNNDGLNDRLHVRGRGITLQQLAIYNRWGQEVFKTSDIMQSWDGYLKGVPQPVGTYFYYIKYTNRQHKEIIKSGDITLVR